MRKASDDGRRGQYKINHYIKSWCTQSLTFRIFSNSNISLRWYAAIRFVMAKISGSFLYLEKSNCKWPQGITKNIATNRPITKTHRSNIQIIRATYGFASCPSKGLTSDSMSMLARTKYLSGGAEIDPVSNNSTKMIIKICLWIFQNRHIKDK